jgi:hypothetical protein
MVSKDEVTDCLEGFDVVVKDVEDESTVVED